MFHGIMNYFFSEFVYSKVIIGVQSFYDVDSKLLLAVIAYQTWPDVLGKEMSKKVFKWHVINGVTVLNNLHEIMK